MKYNIVLIVLLVISISCGGSSSSGDTSLNQTPSNLVIEAEVIGANSENPYGDGSGKVQFTFSAENATLFKLNLGDEEIIETSGSSYTHTYVGIGTKSFEVFISAYNGSKFISTSKTVTVKINSNMTWSDEFNGSGKPSSSKWTFEIGNGSNGWGNGEYQYYTDRLENAKVENGVLKITAKKEAYEGFNYTSARMITLNKFDFKYGRIDIRAKLPSGEGTWPALWLLGSNFSTVGWPACGEIDIMEHWGNNPGKVSSATHTPDCHGGCSSAPVGETTIPDYNTAFHVYSLEWTENELRFLIDDEFKYSYNPSNKTSGNWPYNNPHFIIVNIAMGSSYHSIDPNFVSSTMEIDYLRVYQ